MSTNNKYSKRGGVDAQIGICYDCEEGCKFGEKVYCNIDGRFYIPLESTKCSNFVPRENKVKT